MQLRGLALHGLEFDGDVLVVVEVLAQSQLAEVATSDLFADLETIPSISGPIFCLFIFCTF